MACGPHRRANSVGVAQCAEWGRLSLEYVRQAAILALASLSEMNQFAFRHSWRSLPVTS